MQRADFGEAAIDGDGDGLPDPWELYRFGNLGQVPGSPGAGGLTVLQHFIAGTDPNNPQGTFHLRINRTNSLDRVWFVAQKAEGPGYDGMTRRYTLESRLDLSTGVWANVPGYINVTATNQTVELLTPGPKRPRVLSRPHFFVGIQLGCYAPSCLLFWNCAGLSKWRSISSWSPDFEIGPLGST